MASAATILCVRDYAAQVREVHDDNSTLPWRAWLRGGGPVLDLHGIGIPPTHGVVRLHQLQANGQLRSTHRQLTPAPAPAAALRHPRRPPSLPPWIK